MVGKVTVPGKDTFDLGGALLDQATSAWHLYLRIADIETLDQRISHLVENITHHSVGQDICPQGRAPPHEL